MATINIRQGQRCVSVSTAGSIRADEALALAGLSIPHPCGGRGTCGKCAIIASGSVSEMNQHEQAAGTRLSCQTIIHGDAELVLPLPVHMTQIETGMYRPPIAAAPMPGRFGAAVDIGTTTLALSLFDLSSGACVAMSSMANPQIGTASDVIGRIDAAIHGRLNALRQDIVGAVNVMLRSACEEAQLFADDVCSMVVTGNTTMLYLLTGRDPSALSHAPFEADHLFGEEYRLLNRLTYLPRCLHAFVGADTTCAILACGMLESEETTLLCDIGTNGELVLWHKGQLYITSTAAGPAFEGAGIRYGCSSVPGAIDSAEIENGQLAVHTIGGCNATGICGSGLVDILAKFLKLGILDETGSLDEPEIPLANGICLTQQDVRAVQLAKAAIAAGISCLLKAAGCPEEAVRTCYIAGGFGTHLNIPNAARIGLIPSGLADKVKVIGNAALNGAAMMLLDTTCQARFSADSVAAIHVRLDGNPLFSQRYIDEMLFPE